MASSNKFVFTGLDELKAALRTLPADLTAEASHIVEGAANGATADIKASYPIGSAQPATPGQAAHVPGNLRDHVFVTHFDKGRFGVGVIVKSTAKHAWLFDHGSQARHTANGANRGSMPARPTFIPAMMRARRLMYSQLADLLTRHGLQVSGVA